MRMRMLRGWLSGASLAVGQRLERYFALCGLVDSQVKTTLRALCRVELFDRFGMAHTCCLGRHGPFWDDMYALRWKVRKPKRGVLWALKMDEEVEDIREEQSEYSGQIDMLMAEYMAADATYQGTARDFWNLWWEVADLIIPPIARETYEPVCDKRKELIMRLREERATEAVEAAGYDPEIPFTEVIQSHFDKHRGVFSGQPWPDSSSENEHATAASSRPQNGDNSHFLYEGGTSAADNEADDKYRDQGDGCYTLDYEPSECGCDDCDRDNCDCIGCGGESQYCYGVDCACKDRDCSCCYKADNYSLSEGVSDDSDDGIS